MDNTIRMPCGIPFTILIFYSRNRRRSIAFVTLYDAFRIVEIADGIERHPPWTTIHIQTELCMVVHFGSS